MDNGTRRKTSIFRYLKISVLTFLGIGFLGLSRPVIAGNVQVVKGIVGTVSGSLIYLNGKSVDLSGIPVRKASGTKQSFSDITPGKKIGLWYRRGSVISVLVYDSMVE
jgi:hypothetical protein